MRATLKPVNSGILGGFVVAAAGLFAVMSGVVLAQARPTNATPPLAATYTATHTVTQISLEAAQVAAQAALARCRKAGFQVAVAVVDRFGGTIVVLRDRFAGAHTVDTATNKAWTSASFKISTTALGIETQPNKPSAGIRQLPRVVTVGGGLTINAMGSLVGAIGVSGAPGGDADEVCANAGITAIADDLAF